RLLMCRGAKRFGWIQRGIVRTVFQQSVSQRRLLAHCISELLELRYVQRYVVGKAGELERQAWCICQPQRRPAAYLRQRDPVDEAGIAPRSVVFIGVVERVVAAALALTTESQVHRGYTQVLQERGVVGSRTHRVYPQVFALLGLVPRFAVGRIYHQLLLSALLECQFGLRVENVIGNLVQKTLQCVAAADADKAPAVG